MTSSKWTYQPLHFPEDLKRSNVGDIRQHLSRSANCFSDPKSFKYMQICHVVGLFKSHARNSWHKRRRRLILKLKLKSNIVSCLRLMNRFVSWFGYQLRDLWCNACEWVVDREPRDNLAMIRNALIYVCCLPFNWFRLTFIQFHVSEGDN